MDFTKNIAVNITNLRIKVAKLKDLGIPVDYPILAVIVLAEVKGVVGHKLAFEFKEALRDIKKTISLVCALDN